MTEEEFRNLKVGDELIRIDPSGNSPRGYITKVISHPPYLRITHQTGLVDSIVPSYWAIHKKKEPNKSGFAKFIKRVEA